MRSGVRRRPVERRGHADTGAQPGDGDKPVLEQAARDPVGEQLGQRRGDRDGRVDAPRGAADASSTAPHVSAAAPSSASGSS